MLKDVGEFVPGPNLLVTGGLIDKRDDADLGQAACQDLSRLRDRLLFGSQFSGSASIEIDPTDQGKHLGPVPPRLAAALPHDPERDGLDQLAQFIRDELLQVVGHEERRAEIGTIATASAGFLRVATQRG